jgi:HEAT repeat protein
MSLSAEDRELVGRYFAEWWRVVRQSVDDGLCAEQWKKLLPSPPIAAMQAAALHHPNARVRRECLGVLDHDANDASVDVFRAALGDPVPRVRQVALHGLACERCREEALCVTDVVPTLVHALEHDDNAKVRHAAVGILLSLSERDRRAGDAIRDAMEHDPDELVRRAARAASEGRYRGMASRKAIRRRARRTA